MNRTTMATLGAACVTAALLGAGARRDWSRPAPAALAISAYQARLDTLSLALGSLDSAVVARDGERARRAFRVARRAYKRIELFAEYNGAFLVREINGVNLPRAEDEDPEAPLPPVGLQVIEAALFPSFDSSSVDDVRRQIQVVRRASERMRNAGADTLVGDAYVFDAMRQEIARVAVLGLAGFDATITRDVAAEAAAALDGVRLALAPYREHTASRNAAVLDTLDRMFELADAWLRANTDFERLDRLTFIAAYANPLAHALADVQRTLGIGRPAKPRAWSGRAASIFDGVWDTRYFAAVDAPDLTPRLVALGRRLFHEPKLSASGTRSCATCHVPERAFTDGRALPDLMPGHSLRAPPRNTPTLINAALQPALFADNRVRTLEDQATDVLGSAREMGGSLADAARALARNDGYARDFAAAFGAHADTALTPRTLRLALAAYVRSLVALDSRFDRAVRGDTNALTSSERRGFTVFMGRGLCGTCHFIPLFHGALPPTLWESEPEVIGVPARTGARHAVVDPDSGRYRARHIAQQLHAFKTPTLRNVELTAPYMHNGAFRTLEDVIDFYDAGGGRGLGLDLAHQTLPPDSLHLTKREKADLVAFLKSLTDTVGTTAR